MLVFFILPGKRVHVFTQGVHATPSSLRLCLYSYLAIHGEVIGNLQYRKLRAESERQVDVRWNKRNQCSQEFVSKRGTGASLVAQWLRICLPMQGTRVRALVWEDPTCCGATRPVSHNYWACASGAYAPQQERPRRWETCAPRRRVAPACRN